MAELLNDDIDICADCYQNHHEGRAMADTSVGWTDNTGEDGEGVTDFSRGRCGCCGTDIAGTRYRMAIWSA